MSEYISCPFCGEPDFDLIGLKCHLSFGHCEPYESTSTWILGAGYSDTPPADMGVTVPTEGSGETTGETI